MATVSMTSKGGSAQAGSGRNYRFAFGLVTTLFFIFGFITCLNDILVPHLKSLFTLDYTQAALVQFCFFAAYFVISLPSGRIVTKYGYQRGAVIGLVITAIGCLIFYPAADQKSYPIFLLGLFVLASGITLIQVAVNPYIAILGPPSGSSVRLNLAQAFNSLGTTLAPLFGSAVILSAMTSSGADQAAAVEHPYLGLAAALLVLAAIFGFVKLPQIEGAAAADQSNAHVTGRTSAWQFRHLVLGAVGIFCYVGAEVSIGSYIVNFLGLKDVMSMPAVTAGNYVAYYWGGAMVGRFVGAAVLTKVSPRKVLTGAAITATVLILLAMATQSSVAMIAILSIGLFNSIMFPTIFTLAIDGLGKFTAQASGILCMAIVGGAVIPLLQGVLADKLGLHHSYWLPVLCYLYIAYYGWRGAQEKRA